MRSTVSTIPRIDAVQVVIGEGQEEAYARRDRRRSPGLPLLRPVIGGATRRESVLNGLEALVDAERVLIHDAARPFLPAAVIDRLLDALETSDGAVPALPLVDTPGAARRRAGAARRSWCACRRRRPSASRRSAAPIAPGPAATPTDDAQVARAAGYCVALVEGDPALEKLTYEADFLRAEAALLTAAGRLRLRRPRARGRRGALARRRPHRPRQGPQGP